MFGRIAIGDLFIGVVDPTNRLSPQPVDWSTTTKQASKQIIIIIYPSIQCMAPSPPSTISFQAAPTIMQCAQQHSPLLTTSQSVSKQQSRQARQEERRRMRGICVVCVFVPCARFLLDYHGRSTKADILAWEGKVIINGWEEVDVGMKRAEADWQRANLVW